MRHALQAQYPEYAGKVKLFISDVRNIDSVRDGSWIGGFTRNDIWWRRFS